MFNFSPGTSLPANLLHFRYPPMGAFTISPPGRPNSLRITPSRANLTGEPAALDDPSLSGTSGIAFVGRRQAHTLFTFSVDLTFRPQYVGQEAGVTVFLTQINHIDLYLLLHRKETLNKHGKSLDSPSKPKEHKVQPISLLSKPRLPYRRNGYRNRAPQSDCRSRLLMTHITDFLQLPVTTKTRCES